VSPVDAEPELRSWAGGGGPEAAALLDLERGEEYRSALAVLTDRPVELAVRPHEETVRLLRSWPGGG
jgi:4'-phosphopantetheinyl transferase